MGDRIKFLRFFLVFGIILGLFGVSTAQGGSDAGRFQLNSDGSVLDSKTGLMWSNHDNGADINWEDAKSYSESFDGGGFGDWRLPTSRELITIFNPASPAKFKTFPPFTLTGCCPWTADTRRSQARSIFFMMGERNWYSKSDSTGFRVLPVRNATGER